MVFCFLLSIYIKSIKTTCQLKIEIRTEKNRIEMHILKLDLVLDLMVGCFSRDRIVANSGYSDFNGVCAPIPVIFIYKILFKRYVTSKCVAALQSVHGSRLHYFSVFNAIQVSK